jgi:adenylate kinase family enzyme
MTSVPRHILIVGSSGSGKSTLAKWLSARLDIPHIELDGLFWEPNWTKPSPEAFRVRVEAAVTGDSWIIDGNYSKVRDLIWPKADMLIWLDLPLWYCLWQVARRCVARAFTQYELWSGNRESIRLMFFSRRSLLLWIVRTHGTQRRNYKMLVKSEDVRHMQVYHFMSRGDAYETLERLQVSSSG